MANNSEGKPGMISSAKMPAHTPPFQIEAEAKERMVPEIIRPKHVRQKSKEDSSTKRQLNSPLHDNATSGWKVIEGTKGLDAPRSKHERQLSREDGDTAGRRGNGDSLHQHQVVDIPKRSTRPNAGYNRTIEHSPVHPRPLAKVGDRGGGVSSPSSERKVSSEVCHGFGPSTPGRSRLRPVRGDETPDRDAAVPKFGEWDENNPSAADGYTHIFGEVLKERQNGGGTPGMPSQRTHPNGDRHFAKTSGSKSCCCFPWGGK